MASYKVPQDVEAEDKLLGPFTFRQFIYLIIVVVAIGIGYVLYQLLPPLVVLPLPVVLFFGALALPLRKDQPMEIYLAAILSFYLKPRQRLWNPDGIQSLVSIATPPNTEPQRTKGVSASEADQRLRYLSNLADSRGWSVRNIHNPAGSSMNDDVFNEAQQTEDILDDSNAIARNLGHMIEQSDQRRHQDTLDQFRNAATQPAALTVATPPQIPDPYASLALPTAPAQATDIQYDAPSIPQYNPYPASMNQSVIQPLSEQPAPAPVPENNLPPEPVLQPAPAPAPIPQSAAQEVQPQNASAQTVSPDIINLANSTNLSIETIAREAQRVSKKEQSLEEGEVFISLR